MTRTAASAPRHRTLPRRVRGFTLIELMIAVTIVGILVAIAYPAYTDSVRKSRRAQAKADLAELTQLAERWYTANNSYAGFFARVKTDNMDYSPRTKPRAQAFYVITRDAGADTAASTFTLTATAQGDQASDACKNLTIDATGKRGTSSSRTDCW
ncbi:type IV pilin protein [Lysobacter enzymogenes]|uniref:type IV pilin protein n=1 Tax=Lysobacter enzymogenes TaxID=69 RepID=UPI00099DA50E|nr:type IV pilin protein [Lysobacter enzymogenes]QQQ02870.1 type IV pilin protein [Lysobacter enzymogenes]UZW62316.1 type IV pilin protein [Lysobacter enzymogenes]